MRQWDHIADDLIALIAQSLDDRVLIVLAGGEDPYLRVVHQGFEARIWQDSHAYTYEIVSLGAVIARGEAGNAYQALERTIPLSILLSRSSRAHRAA